MDKKTIRKRKRRRKAIRRRLCLFLMVICMAAAVRTAAHSIISRQHRSATANAAVGQPVRREGKEVLEALRVLGKTNPAAKSFYENSSEYPEALLASYLNNQEMEEFVKGYPEGKKNPKKEPAEFTSKETKQKSTLLLQWDKRWGYVSYGESVIGLSGCGPTCLSMVLLQLMGGNAPTPDEVAAFSQENGYCVKGKGTAWSLMTEGASRYGLEAKEVSLSQSVMEEELDMGRPIICSLGAGDFTTEGHFIVIFGYTEAGFAVNDPNCIARSGQSWSYEELSPQIKNLWSYQSE